MNHRRDVALEHNVRQKLAVVGEVLVQKRP